MSHRRKKKGGGIGAFQRALREAMSGRWWRRESCKRLREAFDACGSSRRRRRRRRSRERERERCAAEFGARE